MCGVGLGGLQLHCSAGLPLSLQETPPCRMHILFPPLNLIFKLEPSLLNKKPVKYKVRYDQRFQVYGFTDLSDPSELYHTPLLSKI